MTLALATFQVQPTSTLTEPLTLRLWYNSNFLDVDNVPVLAGPKDFYIEFDCSLSGGVITVTTENIYTTLDANVQNPQSINCSAQFFVGNSGKEYLFTQWVIPSEAEYPGGTITFAQLSIYNDGSNTLANPPATYLTSAQTTAYFATLSPAPDAATNVKGIGFVSVAPVTAGSPIFLGQNDPAVASSTTVSTNSSIAISAATSNSTNTSSAGSRVTSNSINISVADSKAVSDSVVISTLTTTTDSKAASNSLNISVADSKAVSDSVVISTLTTTSNSKDTSQSLLISTADSKAVSNSINISTAGSQNTSQSLLISTADSKAVSDSVVTSTLTTTTNSAIASLSTNLSVTTSTANSG